MASVAGSIRIEMIANTARFTGGLREGGQALNSFHDQFQKVQRGFNSQKAVGERIGAESAAWKSSMKELRADYGMNARGSMLPWYSMERMNLRPDQAERNRIRWANMLPWGNTMRTTLTAEAAATAAAIGDGTKKIGHALRASHGELTLLAGEIGGAAGFGGLGMMARFFTSPLGIAAAAATLYTVKAIADAREHNRLAGEARHAAFQAGIGVEDASKLLYAGVDPMHISRMQRALWEGNPRQAAAFSELGLDRRELTNLPATETLGKVFDSLEGIVNPAKQTALAMDLFGKSGAEILPVMKEFREKLKDMPAFYKVTPAEAEEAKASERAAKGAKSAAWGIFSTKWWNRRFEDVMTLRPLTLMGKLAESEGSGTPFDDPLGETRRGEDWRQDNADELARMAVNKRKHYAQVDAEMRRRNRRLGIYDQQDIEDRAALGVKSSYAVFKQSMKALDLVGGLVTEAERSLAERQFRRQAIGDVMSGYSDVQPVAAMALGSSEAYSAIVANQLADPKLALAAEANAKLDEIVRHLKILASQGRGPGGRVLN